ncbi:hypothetical protein DS901_13480 [Loktanella sp. D2R18]|uniref:hypothetical protein n=1 Tax=Rhodobacterales TaxID=204455 RepID=UPI000DEB2D86|nr:MULTISPECIES: hypothetical protein [Rhodobacterales]MDO6589014.1 hypothetical protein [Yoonia sp. 1_MG-2023]RBW41772.1 hypothetical protein DS901_13480 [Loktanella sp. D2R18]
MKISAAIIAALLTTPAMADEITSYYAALNYADSYNSRGEQLYEVGAILQQDRANVHRFGVMQEGDEIDGLFGNAEMRAQIPTLYENGPKVAGVATWLEGGGDMLFYVSVCGTKSRAEYLIVNFGDGDLAYTCD